MSLSIINLTDLELPLQVSTCLIEILNELMENYLIFNPKLNWVGNIDELMQWCNWSMDRKHSIDRKLYTINLLELENIKHCLKLLTNGGVMSGAFYYPPDGWMGWHTNLSNYKKDTRLYITHNDNIGSRFLYRKNNKTYYIEEPIGWSIKYFDVSKPFWHSVISKSNRYSFGFRYVTE